MVVRTILNGASIPAIKITAQSMFSFAMPTRRTAAGEKEAPIGSASSLHWDLIREMR
jgi:hypothetical protein